MPSIEIDRAIRLISQNPQRWPPFDKEMRRFLVRKFPCLVIYEVHGEEVVVLTVAYGSRKPYYWRERRGL